MPIFKTSYDDGYFNTIFDTRLGRKEKIANTTDMILKYIQGGELLELGCGEGEHLAAYQKYFSVHGMDISRDHVKKTNELIGKNIAVCMDIEKGVIKGKYDVIVALDVLEHLHDPEKIIKKLLSKIKPGGFFIFAVPNYYGFVGTIATKIFNYLDRTHISVLKRAEWIEIIARTGYPYQEVGQVGIFFTDHRWSKYVAFDLVVVVQVREKNRTKKVPSDLRPSPPNAEEHGIRGR
jgi:2-polyprenyl-3-methyl-5-hydroxy-6-metoxy-1,4-benzoquinol methylase